MEVDSSTSIEPAPTSASVTAEWMAFSTLWSDAAVVGAKLMGIPAPQMTDNRSAPLEVSASD